MLGFGISKVNCQVFPFWHLGFGGLIQYLKGKVQFLFQYPDILSTEESQFDNRYAFDILGLFQEFEDLEYCPTLEEAYFLILSHLRIQKKQIHLLSIQLCDDYGTVKEEFILFQGNIKQLILDSRKIKIIQFGQFWEYHDSGIFLKSSMGKITQDLDFYFQVEQKVRTKELECVLKLNKEKSKN